MDLLIPKPVRYSGRHRIFTGSFILTKFAWKPLLKGLKERDNSIAQALQAAEIAKRSEPDAYRQRKTVAKQNANVK
jgi:F0F1-type ATP synthase membrane subunit b/b'